MVNRLTDKRIDRGTNGHHNEIKRSKKISYLNFISGTRVKVFQLDLGLDGLNVGRPPGVVPHVDHHVLLLGVIVIKLFFFVADKQPT